MACPKKVYIDAPCKINLHLGIWEKRPDGFHDLESLFACLAFADTLKIECTGKDEDYLLSVETEPGCGYECGEMVSPLDNLVSRAVSLFRERTGYRNGLRAFLKKCIPIGAGLGGGSSDAASTLLALNFLAGNLASMKDLMEMAAVLGSDVPFFLNGGLAFVGGRGERIEPVGIEERASLAGLSFVLVKPPFSSDTANAYLLLDQARESGIVSRREMLHKEVLLRSLAENPGTWPFYNDFLEIDKIGVYGEVLKNLREAGASFAGLSGTGSCCFGIFCAKKAAEEAVKSLGGRGNFIRLTFFLANRANPVVE